MMRLPNPLDVRGGEFPSAYDFCPGKLKVGEPRESKAKKKSKKPTGNPKKYLECNITRVCLKCHSSLKVAIAAKSVHKTIDLDTVNSRAKVKLILMGGWAQAQGCSRGQDFIFHY